MVIRINSLDGLNQVVESIISLFDDEFQLVLFSGELGAGKTTLIKSLCDSLGVQDPVSSPTFAIIQEYSSTSRGIIYHMDFYRLQNQDDLERIGIGEYLDSGNLCLIEWPELGRPYYKMPYIEVIIDVEKNNIRNFKITTNDAVDA